MWDETYWGPMMFGGWWFMPLLGIVFMVVFMYLFSRFFSANGGSCSRHKQGEDLMKIFAEYRREIHELRMEIKELRNRIDTNNYKPEGS